MSKSEEIRYVFTRDKDKTIEGFSSYEDAKKKADTLEENDTQRVRVRFRSRTNLWDVVVKTRHESKAVAAAVMSVVSQQQGA